MARGEIDFNFVYTGLSAIVLGLILTALPLLIFHVVSGMKEMSEQNQTIGYVLIPLSIVLITTIVVMRGPVQDIIYFRKLDKKK